MHCFIRDRPKLAFDPLSGCKSGMYALLYACLNVYSVRQHDAKGDSPNCAWLAAVSCLRLGSEGRKDTNCKV